MTDEGMRERMAHLTTAMGRSLSAQRRRAEAQEALCQERKLGGPDSLAASRLTQARAAENEALAELGDAFRLAFRHVFGQHAQGP